MILARGVATPYSTTVSAINAAAASLPMRDDTVTDGGCREAILVNAPRAAHGFFTVPKVVE